jgi:hypothetical protein
MMSIETTTDALPPVELPVDAKQFRRHRDALMALTKDVRLFLGLLEEAIDGPRTPGSRKAIARLAKELAHANDQVRWCILGEDWRGGSAE